MFGRERCGYEPEGFINLLLSNSVENTTVRELVALYDTKTTATLITCSRERRSFRIRNSNSFSLDDVVFADLVFHDDASC